ncbi:orotate phosphoribosyltransferase [Lentilactobacillus sp. SPB1-3]|uniref:Orotate phosphoribosyltransferase n=1 Tax=Lentilactobacillus terminaliae TaxID=3003483 RepID=A0ACD5DF73_9LACO|nr:orotate phosphoribosyltransferase [Lentilactobacillus sp. SPB1-3]MCZ0976427.1 orotate phosphoribosyltransferase [Lentilactobacillus sp. SPB1-3]
MQTDKIVQQLIDDNIVSISLDKPFRYASGMLAPIYTDFRLTIAIPELRELIVDGLAKIIKDQYPEVTVIGGVATAGIPHAAWVAQKLGLPMIYVRSKPKDHGANKQIEGRISKNDKVVLIDDLISTGGSVLKAVEAVRKAGYIVSGVAAIYTYEFPDADNNFAHANTQLAPLITYSDVIKQGFEEGRFTEKQFKFLSSWHQAPWKWTEQEEAHAN